MKKLATAIMIWSAIITSSAAEKSTPSDSSATSKDIKKVVVTGNTIVYFIQSQKEHVTIDEGEPANIDIKQVGDKLTIFSNQKTPAIITVYFKDIYRIDASEKTIVRSVGKLNLENLQVLLRGEALARIKANTQSIYTVIDDKAKLELLGMTAQHISNTQSGATLNIKKFTALTTKETKAEKIVATRGEFSRP
jgi:hypothetical protein